MGRPKGWVARATGRPALRSPGRRRWPGERIGSGSGRRSRAGCRRRMPPLWPACRRRVGTRWFRDGGGMSSVSMAPLSGRYLSFADREEIAILRARACGVREIARQLRRSASTISRELRRNAATRGGHLDYRATTAQGHADRRSRRPKVAKLAGHEPLHGYVQERLAARSRGRTARRSTVQRCAGSGAGTAVARTGGGRAREARSRSPTGCRWTSPMMRRCDLARGDLPGALRPGPRRAAPGAHRVPAHRPRAARAAGPQQAGQGLPQRRGNDQRTAGGGRRPRRSRALGRRPHSRPA